MERNLAPENMDILPVAIGYEGLSGLAKRGGFPEEQAFLGKM